MNAVTTFLDRLFFTATCVFGWLVFPLLIALGFVSLFCYALIAECLSSMVGPAVSASRDERAARQAADRLCGTL
jgi:hypothetical protein